MGVKLEGPWVRTPLCHVGGIGGWNQYVGGVCATIETNLLECLEAYGYQKGLRYCRGYLEDFNECRFRFKQIARRDAMEAEQGRQYRAGLIKDRYVPPPTKDSY